MTITATLYRNPTRRTALRLARQVTKWHGQPLHEVRGETVGNLLNDLPHYVGVAWQTITDEVLDTVI